MNIKLSDHSIIKSAGSLGLYLVPDRIEDYWRWSVQIYGRTLAQGNSKTSAAAFLYAKQAARRYLSRISIAIDDMTI